jgi:trans-aconitate methyltransferase
MTEEQERWAGTFDHVADDYARERPTYPDGLVDAACAGAKRILEVGCGTGQLTAALVTRGVAVHAIDPAPNMLRLAGRITGATFEQTRFEDFEPRTTYDALLSASAFHWVDPTASWDRAAAVLKPGGWLALMQYVGLATPETAEHDRVMLRALERVDAQIAATWPRPRDAATLHAGVHERRENVSDVWAWLTSKPLAVPDTAFGPADLTLVPVFREQTAEELEALFRTTSFWFQLGDERAAALAAENRKAIAELGGTARWAEAAVLVTAAVRPPHALH